MLPRTSGIYKIVCIPTQKLYVGSSYNMQYRQATHLCELRKHKHANRYLQNAWNKYGENNFVWTVLQCVPVNDLIVCEQKWMDVTNCYKPDCGYNILPNARSPIGVKRSPAYLEKSANSHAQNWIVTDPQGQEQHIRNLTKFCRTHALDITMMSRVAHGRGRSHKGGWTCRHVEMSKQQWEKTLPVPAKDDGRFKSKQYKLTSPDGTVLFVTNLAKFCRENNLSASALNRVACGMARQYKSWTCEHFGSDKDVLNEQYLINIERINARRRQQRKDNPDKVRAIENARKRQQRKDNPDKVNAEGRQYYRKHREAILAKRQKQRTANPEKFNAMARTSYAKHRTERRATQRAYKQKKRLKNAVGT